MQGKLKVGDTLRIFEGSYDIGFDVVKLKGVKVEGVGDREKIVWKSQITIEDGASVVLKNLSIQQKAGYHAVWVRDNATLDARNVRFGRDPEGKIDSVVTGENATINLHNSRVTAYDNSANCAINISGGSALNAKGCGLGWLKVRDSSIAELDNCGGFQYWCINKGKIKSPSVIKIWENKLNYRPLGAENGSTVTLTKVKNAMPEGNVFSKASVVTIDEIEGTMLLVEKDEGKITAGGDAAVPQKAAPEEPTPVTEEPPVIEGDPMADIEALIGLGKVKEQVNSFVSVVKFNEVLKARGKAGFAKSMHSMFLGNPGTGKTTVARLRGKVLFQAGAIRENRFVEVGRQDLVAEHIGGTAKKTQAVLESALGGVLFIDEAYTLHKEGGQDFGQEAIDTILTFMENHRDDIVIIFAGYTKEMQDFLGMNPGLESRVPNRFDFEDYTASEIAEMGIQGLEKLDFTFDHDLYRKTISNKYALASDESNGRWVRNFNEALLTEVAMRFGSDPDADIPHLR